MRSEDSNHVRAQCPDFPALLDTEFDLLIESTRGGRTMFGLDRDGAITWRMTGPERALLYRVTAETGLSAGEIASLTPGSFDLDTDLATVTVAATNSRRRRRQSRPLRQSTAAALREYLLERLPEDPAFPISRRDEMDHMLRADLVAAGIVIASVPKSELGFLLLRVTFLRALFHRRMQRD